MRPDDADEGSPDRVENPIRAEGLLRLAPDTVYASDVHAPGGLIVTSGSVVEGDVYTDGRVELADQALVRGRILPTSAADDDGKAVEPDLSRLGREARGCLRGLGDDEETADGLAELEPHLDLPHDDEAPIPAEMLRDEVYGRLLAGWFPLSVENADRDTFLVRIQQEDAPSRSVRCPGLDVEKLVGMIERIGRRLRPELDVHELTEMDTCGDVVLLVRP